MPQVALVTDYDGTIAHDGTVDGFAPAALAWLRAAGWHLVLATGRELDDLRLLMPQLDLFEHVVAENGAVLHAPASGAVCLLAAPLPSSFATGLSATGVQPIHVGKVMLQPERRMSFRY